MRNAIGLLRAEPRARLFFAVLAQSSLGSGAAYVGLILIAYERYRSPWAISLVLLADFVPAMVVGPFLGAAADRWSRRWCVVSADVVRAGAFLGVVAFDSFPSTVAFALLAGVGTALFKPAALAGLPGLVSSERSPAATSLYGAVTDLGYTAGPAIAGLVLLVGDSADLMVANAATFAVSALVLTRLPLGDAGRPVEGAERGSLLRDTREGIRAAATSPVARVVIAGSAGVMLLGGLFNVAEPLFATDDLDAGGSGYSILVAAFGCGFVFGSLRGAGSRDEIVMKRRYLNGLVLNGVALIASGLSPSLWPALAAFALAGFGNGVLLVHERLLIQATVPESLHGRVFAMSDTLVSWAFALAFVGASPILSITGARTLILAIGVVGLIAAIATALSLRGQWGVSARPAPRAEVPETDGPAVARAPVPVGTLGADADSLGDLGTR